MCCECSSVGVGAGDPPAQSGAEVREDHVGADAFVRPREQSEHEPPANTLLYNASTDP